MDHTPPPFFNRGPAPLVRLAFFASLSLALLVLDARFRYTEGLRSVLALAVYPLQAIASMPGALGERVSRVEGGTTTHFHYDHIGNFDMFPAATFHLQDKEMAFATGRHMLDPKFGASMNVDDVVGMVRHVYGKRARFHDGDTELAPGLSLHHIGGHTAGMQSVRVMTKRGWVMVASDAAHLYANMETRNPFPVIFELEKVFAGYDRLKELAASPDHVVPGHDPLVLRRYPAVSKELDGVAVRLDEAPKK